MIVDFADFLILSGNFGNTGVGYSGGDVDCDGTVAFADFLALSGNFGVSGGIITHPSHLATMTSGTATTRKEYIIQPGVLTNESQLDLNGLSYVDVCIMSVPVDTTSWHMQQSVTFSPDEYIGPIAGQPSCIDAKRLVANQNVAYGDDFGVVNIINCHNLTLREMRVENTRTFSGTTIRTQSSCAINIGDSTEIVIDGCTFKGNGKSVVLVHNCTAANGNPGVKFTNCEVTGNYFEFNFGASDVTVEDTTVFQDHGGPDSHSAVTVTPAYGTQPLNLRCDDYPVTPQYQVATSGLANGSPLLTIQR